MNAEQIRAEAIEVLARSDFEKFCTTATWAEIDEADRATWRPNATRLVDALAAAGLLPTGTERRERVALDTGDEHLVQRYLTEWRAVTE